MPESPDDEPVMTRGELIADMRAALHEEEAAFRAEEHRGEHLLVKVELCALCVTGCVIFVMYMFRVQGLMEGAALTPNMCLALLRICRR